MDSYVKAITLDVNADENYTIIKAKQGDKINRKIAITLKKDGANFTPTGVSQIWFRVQKPDKNIAIVKSTDSGNPISSAGNVYTVTLSEQCLTASGKAWCDLAFLDSSGNTLSSCAFILNIIPMPNGNTARSISEWTDLQQAIDDAERFASIVAFRTSGNYIQYTVDGTTWVNLTTVGAIGGDLQTQINALNGAISDEAKTRSILGAKNFVRPEVLYGRTTIGITTVVNADGTLSISGTATDNELFGIITNPFIPLPNGEYIASVGQELYIRCLGHNGSSWVELAYGLGEQTFTATDDYQYYQFQIRVFNGVTYSGKLYPMIRLATDIDNTFQKYAPTNTDLNGAINAITPLDTTPTSGSTKGVTSGAVASALTNAQTYKSGDVIGIGGIWIAMTNIDATLFSIFITTPKYIPVSANFSINELPSWIRGETLDFDRSHTPTPFTLRDISRQGGYQIGITYTNTSEKTTPARSVFVALFSNTATITLS